MNGVIGMTHILLETDLSPHQRECAQVIHTSGQALLKILDQVLDYSKIEAGALELENSDFDLQECLEDSVDAVAPRASERELYLALLVRPDVPTRVIGDQGRLRQILLNLLNNAMK